MKIGYDNYIYKHWKKGGLGVISLKFLRCLRVQKTKIQAFFRLITAFTGGHGSKLFKPRCHLDIRKYSFAHRIVDIWNSLDDNIIACDSINGFKGKTNKFLYGRGFI